MPTRGETRIANKQLPANLEFEIVLEPLSRPELGEIRIDDGVFAVGRAEQPFASYGEEIVAMLSRRHARIFCEDGAVYLADLESRNGTTVNRVAVAKAPCPIRDGDEICFGGVLSYRATITPRTRHPGQLPNAFAVTLKPASGDASLQPIVITRFPFLVSKNDAAFAPPHGRDAQQQGFLSRRHAHIFRKGAGAFIEDLASTNGTFVDGLRLQEHAVPLEEGMLVAFGGEHFTYRVIISGGSAVEPAAQHARSEAPDNVQVDPKAAGIRAAADKTTFVAAPTSFLHIFCVDDEVNEAAVEAEVKESTVRPDPAQAAPPPALLKRRSRAAVLWSEIAAVVVDAPAGGGKRGWWKAAALAGVLGTLAVALFLWGASERELKTLIASGEHAQAAALAGRLLEQTPDDVDLRSIATETALKANVPVWLERVQQRDFDGAKTVLATLSELGRRNPDLQQLADELEWLGDLERLVSGRGGPDAPIRIYRDEDRIAAVIARWNDNTGEHQRSLARIASFVPQFGEPYALALTHLRKLQSEATVHLAAIDRLKASIAAELDRDNPQALEAVLKEAADKYPRLGGLDSVRQDLARYVSIWQEARNRRSGRLFALLADANFKTPPFQESFRALASSRQIPAAPLVQQYAVATQAWKDGRMTDALNDLQKMAAGPWAEAVTDELVRRQAILTQFASLQASRSASNYAERLLAFRALLDADRDSYFVRATQSDLEQHTDRALVLAQDSMQRARASWQEYRNSGAIEARHRVETAISNTFRTRARWLSEAVRQAELALRIHAQVGVAAPPPWNSIHDEIMAEWKQQRSALQELRNVLEAETLKEKLALLGDDR